MSSTHEISPSLEHASRQLRLSRVALGIGGPGRQNQPLIGVLRGEGIGPEVVEAALRVLRAVEQAGDVRASVHFGGEIGRTAQQGCGTPLPADVATFVGRTFADGGALLCGPGGGRFVYELRRRFDLFFKLAPLIPSAVLFDAGPLKPSAVHGVDVLIVRDNVGGIYQGKDRLIVAADGELVAEHVFTSTSSQIRRLAEVAGRIALKRRGRVSVVVKDGGLQVVTDLWRSIVSETLQPLGLEIEFLNIDLAAYRIVQHAAEFDVILTSNLFGDILSDVGAVLLSSRGNAYSGNFSATGAAAYQTNHGAAYDLAGTGRANPAGQIFSLAMMLRESFGLEAEATLIEAALEAVWAEGFSTADLKLPTARILGTRQMSQRVAQQVRRLAPLYLA